MRALIAGTAFGVALVGGALGVSALDTGDQSTAPGETTDSTVATTTVTSMDTTTSTTAAPAPTTTLAATPPPAAEDPSDGGGEVAPTPVQTPDGPVYPDGYVAPEFRTPEQGGTHTPPTMPTIPPQKQTPPAAPEAPPLG